MPTPPTTPSPSTPRPVAIVTGGLRGIGLATARQLARDGFDLAVIDLAPPGPDCEAVLASLAEHGGRARYHPLDIADLARHDDTLAQIEHDLGPLCCLVNNAGIAARPLTDLLELAPAAFDRSLDVNLRGSFFLTQAFARRLLAMPVDPALCRSIVFVTSIAAEMASTDRAQYCVSKAALSMTARLFAARLAPHGVAVHEVRPGFIQTDMTASAGSATIDQWIAEGRVPMPRWGKPEDVGLAISTLASGRMPYITGQPFWIAGGLNIARAT
ncbi:3-ketoacyl-ACP reductase [Hydrogenophaga atypica]|uniref:3-ketoacyl-ACP reductase n=1 Tax=Hydrogenophaga atypica TaxID=249409 RepID=A0ABW2QPI5_9BURK